MVQSGEEGSDPMLLQGRLELLKIAIKNIKILKNIRRVYLSSWVCLFVSCLFVVLFVSLLSQKTWRALWDLFMHMYAKKSIASLDL